MPDNWQARMIVEEIEGMSDDMSNRGSFGRSAMLQCLANRIRVRLGISIVYACNTCRGSVCDNPEHR